MTLVFRNLALGSDTPVGDWPIEAIQTALERGDIDDWRRMAAEIRDEPWGHTARQVEQVLSYSRPYGVSELMEVLIARGRGQAESDEQEVVAAEVRRLIADSGLTRSEFASRIGTSASRLSTYTTGKVAPSANLMVRMRRVAQRKGS